MSTPVPEASSLTVYRKRPSGLSAVPVGGWVDIPGTAAVAHPVAAAVSPVMQLKGLVSAVSVPVRTPVDTAVGQLGDAVSYAPMSTTLVMPGHSAARATPATSVSPACTPAGSPAPMSAEPARSEKSPRPGSVKPGSPGTLPFVPVAVIVVPVMAFVEVYALSSAVTVAA